MVEAERERVNDAHVSIQTSKAHFALSSPLFVLMILVTAYFIYFFKI